MVLFNFFAIFFWNFELRVWKGRNETIVFIFSLSHPLSTDFGLKLSHNCIFFFFFILLFFWNFLFHFEQERNEMVIFIFLISHPLSTYFGSKWSDNGIV